MRVLRKPDCNLLINSKIGIKKAALKMSGLDIV